MGNRDKPKFFLSNIILIVLEVNSYKIQEFVECNFKFLFVLLITIIVPW